MTLQQGFAFAVVIGMMAMFVWGRLRYDLVAILALLAAVAVGIVPPEEAFSGFSDDILIIVATALILAAAVSRSGVIEILLRRVGPYLTTTQAQVTALVASVTVLSALVKNIGALAMLMPVAFQLARRTGTSPSSLLMPLSFGSLLGGLMTLIGTSPNIIVSRIREEIVGEPFRMFDFLPVGAGIAVTGVIFLSFGYRLLPSGRKAVSSIDAALNFAGYTTEAALEANSPFVGKTVADLVAAAEGEVTVSTIIREKFRRYTPAPDWTLLTDDVLLLDGEPAALERLVAHAGLRLAGSPVAAGPAAAAEETGLVEAVITGDSPVLDQSPAQVRMAEHYHVELLALGRSGQRITHPLRTVRFRVGDIVVLKGSLADLPGALGSLGFLPLAGRDIQLGRRRRSLLPVLILAAAMALAAFQTVPIAVAFLGAAVLVILTGGLTLRQAYEAIDAPILVLLGALIPVSEALSTTGGADLIAGWLAGAAGMLPPMGALTLIIVVAMAVTPFLNNAATVLMMAPISAGLAGKLGYAVDPFLMAVAIGAACDFLTPIGHQCNTLVMGPGGYRFGDYWRLGLPLSILVVLIAPPLIGLVWPF